MSVDGGERAVIYNRLEGVEQVVISEGTHFRFLFACYCLLLTAGNTLFAEFLGCKRFDFCCVLPLC